MMKTQVYLVLRTSPMKHIQLIVQGIPIKVYSHCTVRSFGACFSTLYAKVPGLLDFNWNTEIVKFELNSNFSLFRGSNVGEVESPTQISNGSEGQTHIPTKPILYPLCHQMGNGTGFFHNLDFHPKPRH